MAIWRWPSGKIRFQSSRLAGSARLGQRTRQPPVCGAVVIALPRGPRPCDTSHARRSTTSSVGSMPAWADTAQAVKPASRSTPRCGPLAIRPPASGPDLAIAFERGDAVLLICCHDSSVIAAMLLAPLRDRDGEQGHGKFVGALLARVDRPHECEHAAVDRVSYQFGQAASRCRAQRKRRADRFGTGVGDDAVDIIDLDTEMVEIILDHGPRVAGVSLDRDPPGKRRGCGR